MITIIAAMAQNNCIGKNGALPWRIPEDLKRFKELTSGHPIIMGRKTWESIPEKFRPLPLRKNIVITRTENYALPEGVERASSLEDAISQHETQNPFIIGGAEIYALAMPHATHLEITHVDQVVEGDAFFPPIDPLHWRETSRATHDGFAFVQYTRNITQKHE